MADAAGHGGTEGDPYHGYSANAVYPQLVHRICSVCSSQLATRGKGMRVGALHMPVRLSTPAWPTVRDGDMGSTH